MLRNSVSDLSWELSDANKGVEDVKFLNRLQLGRAAKEETDLKVRAETDLCSRDLQGQGRNQRGTGCSAHLIVTKKTSS